MSRDHLRVPDGDVPEKEKQPKKGNNENKKVKVIRNLSFYSQKKSMVDI
jgi:hypothetical protein